MTLDAATGELALTWKASNPAGISGTSNILRRLPSEAEFMFIGVTGTKRYVDSTLIAAPTACSTPSKASVPTRRAR